MAFILWLGMGGMACLNSLYYISYLAIIYSCNNIGKLFYYIVMYGFGLWPIQPYSIQFIHKYIIYIIIQYTFIGK